MARLSPRAKGFRLAQAACIVGLLFAAISVLWGVGATGGASVILALGAAAVLLMIAAVLPLLALQRPTSPAWHRNVSGLAWLAAGILTISGLVLTAVGLLIQADIIHASATADHGALARAAYLWGPWLLLWGLLAAAALLRGRHESRHE